MELEWLVRMPLSLSRDGNAITVVVGNPNGASRLEVPTEGRKPYKDNLLAYARETWGFDLDKKVAPLLVNPDDSALGRFAAAMSLPERVRILLTQEGDKATARLAAALEELPKLPDGEIGDVRAFWKGLLEKWVNPPKPQEKEEEPGKEDK